MIRLRKTLQLASFLALLSGCFNPTYTITGLMQTSADRSVASFQKNVYPILRRNCSTCHGTTQSPFFASNDVNRAHDELIQSGKVNFQSIENSRLHMRLRDDLHNCWKSCSGSAADMLVALKKWNDERGVDTRTLKTTLSRTIPANLSTTAVVLSFPVDGMFSPPVPGAVFELSVVKFDNFSYRFFGPKLKTRDRIDIYVRGVNVLLNGETSPAASTYKAIDQVVASSSTATTLSTASLILEIANGPGSDSVSISFDTLSLGSGAALAAARFNTAKTLLQTQCSSCHATNPAGAATRPLFSGFTTEAQFTGATWEGRQLVVPGSAETSFLYQVVAGTLTPTMPPSASAGNRASIATQLKTWIDGIPR